jgi:hypothetical protein
MELHNISGWYSDVSTYDRVFLRKVVITRFVKIFLGLVQSKFVPLQDIEVEVQLHPFLTSAC